MWDERRTVDDDPLYFAIRKVTEANTPAGKLVSDMIREEVPDMSVLLGKANNCIRESDASRCIVYRNINPTLTTHDIYTKRQPINEFHRKEFTRFRISGHSLAIETGRWNRRGRGCLPPEERLCPCGQVQYSTHGEEHCVLTQHIRHRYAYCTLDDIFGNYANDKMCNIIYDVLKVYK